MPNFTTEIFTCQADYQHWTATSADALRQRRAFERQLMTGGEPFHVPGSCVVCRKKVELLVDYQYSWQVDGVPMPNWRERLACPECGLNNRMRATIHFLEHFFNPPLSSRFYVAEQLSPIYEWVMKRCPESLGSEYLGDRVRRGETDERGIRNEDLTRLSFADESFDFIVSLDVLEHVPDFESALAESCRVLRPGGRMLLTVPFRTDLAQNLVRARVLSSGELEHLETPEYHGDPLSSEGCLAFYHFGWELLDQARQAGFDAAVAHGYWSRELGYLGDELLVFIAEKGSGGALGRLWRRTLRTLGR